VRLSEAFNEALDPSTDPIEVTVTSGGSSATVDVIESDRLGVRVRSIQVHCAHPRTPEQAAVELPDALRDLPTRLVPTEVDATLGGITLRTSPDDMPHGDFFQVDVRGDHTTIERLQPNQRGDRTNLDWTMTRDQLGRVLDKLGE
jgi:hypothetical protein